MCVTESWDYGVCHHTSCATTVNLFVYVLVWSGLFVVALGLCLWVFVCVTLGTQSVHWASALH